MYTHTHCARTRGVGANAGRKSGERGRATVATRLTRARPRAGNGTRISSRDEGPADFAPLPLFMAPCIIDHSNGGTRVFGGGGGDVLVAVFLGMNWNGTSLFEF